MTRDGIVSILATVVLGIVVSCIGRDWIAASLASDPLAAACFTVCAFSVGYLVCSLVHRPRKEKFEEEVRRRDEELDRLRGENADLKVTMAKLEAELDLKTRDTVDGLDSRMSAIEGGPHWEQRGNGNWSLKLPG